MVRTLTRPLPVLRDIGAMHVVVGVDGSDAGWAALSWACEEADVSLARLTVCQPRREGPAYPSTPHISAIELTHPVLARYVHAARRRLGGGRVSLELPIAEPIDALLDLAERADLLVVAGHAGADPIFQATATRVAARSRCPVVLVRALAEHDSGAFAGHVVVGVDGSAAAQTALRFGFAHAYLHRVPLVAMHVDEGTAGDFWFDDTFLESHFVVEPEALTRLGAQIESIADELHAQGVPVKRALYGGAPVEALRRAAVGARLLVLGRHGHRLPAVLRLGSVSRAFAAHANGVVAVVPETY